MKFNWQGILGDPKLSTFGLVVLGVVAALAFGRCSFDQAMTLIEKIGVVFGVLAGGGLLLANTKKPDGPPSPPPGFSDTSADK